MTQRMVGRFLVVLTGMLLAHSLVVGQSVMINGVPLVTTRTPVTMGGSMLLPMRDVFEALQSEVKWFASEQKVMAIRGQTTIELWLGRSTATINGQPMQMPVAPQMINGSTYVPLRFPAEAFGGSVEWQAATRTAMINIPPLGTGTPTVPTTPVTPTTPTTPTTPVTPTTPTTPVTPPAPQATTVEGTLVQVIPVPSSIIISVSGTGLAQAVTVGPNTVFTRHTENQPPQAVRLTDATAGDYAVATVSPAGIAEKVDFTYGEAKGVIAGISDNTILLKDNKVFSLSPTVTVVDQTGKQIALTDAPDNAPVTLRYQPTSKVVWQMQVTMPTQQPTTPTTPAKPEIILVGLLNDSPLFKGGDEIRLQLRGTPAGEATVTLGQLFRDLQMQEVEAGTYQAEFTVPAGTNLRNQILSGSLSVNGVKAQTVTSQTRVTIDSIPPEIAEVVPADGQTVQGRDAVIEAQFLTGNGTQINPTAGTLKLNGVAVRGATINADRMTFQAQNLPLGQVRAEVSIADLAGNTATRNWTFNVAAIQGAITSATHNALTTLVAGNTLQVSAKVTVAGGQATFDLGDLRQGLAMNRYGVTNTYIGTYLVRATDQLQDGVVRVRYRDPNGNETQMEIANRVTIDNTLPTALAITAPANNSKVGDTIVVRGEAPVNAKVRVTITYQVLGVIGGQLWQGTVAANAGGDWETPATGSNTGLFGKADEYTVTAEQLDAANQVVATKQIKLKK